MMVSARTEELQQSNRSLRVAPRARWSRTWRWPRSCRLPWYGEGNVDMGAFAAYARMTPAQQVGGDFVDVLEPSGGKLFFTVCDVSGKGVAAALSSWRLRRAPSTRRPPRARTATSAPSLPRPNRRLCGENPMGLFVTGVLGIVDLQRGSMQYVCAGHEPAFLVAADDSRRPLPMTGGGWRWAVLDDFEYESREEELRPGDALFLYTDGLTDAVNLSGELFGKERLESTLDGASSRSPEENRGPRLEPDPRLFRGRPCRRRHDLSRAAVAADDCTGGVAAHRSGVCYSIGSSGRARVSMPEEELKVTIPARPVGGPRVVEHGGGVRRRQRPARSEGVSSSISRWTS